LLRFSELLWVRAIGVAIGSSPGAVADPIVDDWPDLSQLMAEFTALF